MNGSEKQIKWATEIKTAQLPLIDAGIKKVTDKIADDWWGYDADVYDEMRANLAEFEQLVKSNENASFWIDRRNRTAETWEQTFYQWEADK